MSDLIKAQSDPKAGFGELAEKIYNLTGIVLQESKVEMIVSRLRKRMNVNSTATLGEYCRLLRIDTKNDELNHAISALTTNVSSFFRESHHFQLVENELINRGADSVNGEVRLWSAGCSNGQEAYSLAMTLLEQRYIVNIDNAKILATDIDRDVVEFAKRGIYSQDQVQNVPQELLNKYFIETTNFCGRKDFQIRNEVKKLVHFKILNLFEEWPMQRKFDVIFCRNVVIYFDEKAQGALWPKFFSALSDQGFIAVGHSERIDYTKLKSFGPTAYKKSS